MLIRVRATCETSLPTRSADSAKERYTFAMLENGPPGNGTAAGLRFAHYPQQAYVNLSDVSLDEEQTQHQTRHDGEEIDGWHHAIELMDQETSRKMIAYATTAKKIRNVLNSNTGLSPRTRARAQQTLAQNNHKVAEMVRRALAAAESRTTSPQMSRPTGSHTSHTQSFNFTVPVPAGSTGSVVQGMLTETYQGVLGFLRLKDSKHGGIVLTPKHGGNPKGDAMISVR